MAFNDKHNDADGRDPDFGAIFMSNSGTRKECFKRKLFGLPSSEIQFVEQIKAGMILFLFEYEKRQLHGVFKASCDGGMNIVPNAFTSLGKNYPAQVKFVPVWCCKPLPDKLFRDAIRENYFSANKFNFGLSEKQVHKLLYLFSMRKLELDVPGRLLTGQEYFKSERHSLVKAGRSVDCGTRIESVHNELGGDDNISPFTMHKFRGDSLQYKGDVEYLGLNASDRVVSKEGGAAEPLGVDIRSLYVGDHLASIDESRFTAPMNEDYMDFCFRPNVIAGYSKSPSDKSRVHGDSRLSVNGRLVSEDLRNTDQRMLLSDDLHLLRSEDPRKNDQRMPLSDDFPVLCGEDLRKADHRMLLQDDIFVLRNSNVNSSVFYGKPILERNSLVQNQLRPSYDMINPIHTQILNNSYTVLGEVSSNSTILYEPDFPSLNFSHSSSVGIDKGSKSIMASASPSNNCRVNSLSSQPSHLHTELKDMNRWHDIGGDFLNSVYTGNGDCLPFNTARNSNQLASESLAYEICDPIHHLDIGSSVRVHEPYSFLFCNCKSGSGNSLHSAALRENTSHGTTLQKINESVTTVDPCAIEGHSRYDDLLIHEYDIRCYGDSLNNDSGYPKKNNSVFSRLSFKKDVKKPKHGNNAWNEEYDFHTSVDEVMERVRQSHSQWMPKRKLKHSKRNKAGSLRDETQIISSLMKNDCSKNTLDNLSTDLSTASGGRNKAESLRDKTQIISARMKNDCSKNNLEDLSTDLTTAIRRRNKAESLRDKTQIINSRVKSDYSKNTVEDRTDLTTRSGGNKAAEEICFVDFKRRSKVRKVSDKIEIRSPNESDKSENMACVQQKRRKLIRPNFSKNIASGDKGIDLGTSQNLQVPLSHGRYNLKDVSESCCALVQTEDNIKTDAEVPNIVGQTHSEDKNIDDSRGSFCSKGGEKATGVALTAFNDGSEFLENINNQNDFCSASCREKCCHVKEGLHKTDDIISVSLDTKSLHLVCQEHHINKILPAGSDINTEVKMTRDFISSFSNEVGSECIENFGNDKTPIEVKEGLHVMDSIKRVSPSTESLLSVCYESHGNEFICSGKCINVEEEMSKDAFTVEAEVCYESHGNEFICSGKGINVEEEMSKDGFTVEAEAEFDCSQNSDNHDAPIATSWHIKEGLCMTDSIQSVSQDSESLHSVGQERQAVKVICASRSIEEEEC